MKNILYITNISDGVTSFSYSSVMAANKSDYSFHLAGNFSNASVDKLKSDEEKYGVKIHQINLSRSPYSTGNIKAYKELCQLIKAEKIDYIHCNTPVGGMLGRLAGKKEKVKKIIYQVHGFHFYKGAPKKNWMVYYPIERFLARMTDGIVTINQEDYQMAEKLPLKKKGNVYKVSGVGINYEQYESNFEKRCEKRAELGFATDDIVAISMGDLIDRKNYQVAFEGIKKCNNSKLHYCICGDGPYKDKLVEKVKELGIESRVHFLGFRSDIKELLNAADIFILSSKQEGLPRSLMEAMASGLPCVVSNIRGNVDLLQGTEGGFICDDVNQYSDALGKLCESEDLRQKMKEENLNRIKDFGMNTVIKQMVEVYNKEFEGND